MFATAAAGSLAKSFAIATRAPGSASKSRAARFRLSHMMAIPHRVRKVAMWIASPTLANDDEHKATRNCPVPPRLSRMRKSESLTNQGADREVRASLTPFR